MVSVKVKVKSLSRVQLYQAPPSMGFSKQEYWSWLPFPSPGDLSDPGIEPGPPALQADSFQSEAPGKPPKQAVVQKKTATHITWVTGKLE